MSTVLEYAEKSDDLQLKELLCNIFEKADAKASKAIQENVSIFITLLQECLGKSGIKWDDLCIKHEWNVEMKDFLESHKSLGASLSEIEKAMLSHKYMFSVETLKQWIASPSDSLT